MRKVLEMKPKGGRKMRKITVVGLVLVVLAISFVAFSDGERVLRASFAWPTYIDPAVGTDYSSTASIVNLYDGLVFPDVEGRGDPLPHVATSWEVSDDGLVWTFYLREDVMFHDGTPLTAEDVKFSMDRMSTIGEGFAYLFAGRISSSDVIASYTIRFHLTDPFGPFLVVLYNFSIMNKALVLDNIRTPGPYGDMGDYGKEFLLTSDAGSGPYVVKEFRLQEELVMTKNPDYWLPIPEQAPDELRFLGTTHPTTVRTLMSRRELEITDMWQSAEALTALDALEGIDIARYPAGGGITYHHMNTKKAPTDDVHFRRAMAWATDYDTVTQYIFPGHPSANGPIPRVVLGADPSISSYYRDLDRAREELQQSIYYDQLDEIEVEFHWIAEVPAEEKLALLFQANMAEIGIKVKVVKVPWMSVVEEMAQVDTSPNVVTIIAVARYLEAGSLLTAAYHSSSAATWEQNAWLLDPKFDAQLEDALATIDDEERYAKYGELQHYLIEFSPTIFLFEHLTEQAYQSAYVDWPQVTAENMPALYYLAARFIKVYPEKRAELLE